MKENWSIQTPILVVQSNAFNKVFLEVISQSNLSSKRKDSISSLIKLMIFLNLPLKSRITAKLRTLRIMKKLNRKLLLSFSTWKMDVLSLRVNLLFITLMLRQCTQILFWPIDFNQQLSLTNKFALVVFLTSQKITAKEILNGNGKVRLSLFPEKSLRWSKTNLSMTRNKEKWIFLIIETDAVTWWLTPKPKPMKIS